MEFVHCEFGHGICRGKTSTSWHVLNVSSKYKLKPEALVELLGSAAGVFVVHVERCGYLTSRSRKQRWRYTIIAPNVMDRDKLQERMEEIEQRVADMEDLHRPEEWLEKEPCGESAPN